MEEGEFVHQSHVDIPSESWVVAMAADAIRRLRFARVLFSR